MQKKEVIEKEVHYYDPQTKGFYSRLIHGKKVPSGAIALEDAHYYKLLEYQSQGMIIGLDDLGRVTATEPPFNMEAKTLVLKAARKTKELSGIQVDEIFVPTDEKTERRISAAALQAIRDTNYQITDWTVGGSVITLSADKIMKISTALNKHFQACFSAQSNTEKLLQNKNTPQEIVDAFNVQYDFCINQ